MPVWNGIMWSKAEKERVAGADVAVMASAEARRACEGRWVGGAVAIPTAGWGTLAAMLGLRGEGA
jgi:hypothetical protein